MVQLLFLENKKTQKVGGGLFHHLLTRNPSLMQGPGQPLENRGKGIPLTVSPTSPALMNRLLTKMVVEVVWTSLSLTTH